MIDGSKEMMKALSWFLESKAVAPWYKMRGGSRHLLVLFLFLHTSLMPTGIRVYRKDEFYASPTCTNTKFLPSHSSTKRSLAIERFLCSSSSTPFVERGITSTASVPPQDIEEPLWRDAGVEEMMREKLPVELKEEIEDILSRRKNGNAKWGLTKEEALQNRLI